MIEGILAPWHWIILVVVLLLIFGPSKLPGIASSLGKGISSVRKEIKDVADDSKGMVKDLKDLNPLSGLNPLATDDANEKAGDKAGEAAVEMAEEGAGKVPAQSADKGLISASTLKTLATSGGLKPLATAVAVKKVTSPTAVLGKLLLPDETTSPTPGVKKESGTAPTE